MIRIKTEFFGVWICGCFITVYRQNWAQSREPVIFLTGKSLLLYRHRMRVSVKNFFLAAVLVQFSLSQAVLLPEAHAEKKRAALACVAALTLGGGYVWVGLAHNDFPPPARSFGELGGSVKMSEKMLTFWGDQFVIHDSRQTYGAIRQNVISFTKNMTLYGPDQMTEIATGKARFFSIGSKMDVVDAAGRKIGSVQEHVLESLLKVSTHYTILDAAGNTVADSDKSEFFSTHIAIRTPDGRVIATMHRGPFQVFADRWWIDLANDSAVDKRILMLIPAFKRSVDNDRSAQSSSKKR
jgi:uncharacterized protein YxjI